MPPYDVVKLEGGPGCLLTAGIVGILALILGALFMFDPPRQVAPVQPEFRVVDVQAGHLTVPCILAWPKGAKAWVIIGCPTEGATWTGPED